MKAKAFKIVNLILAVLVCVFALSQAFAWFAEDMRKSGDKFDGSSASPYFESGTGTSNDPFIISTKHHMYNLAWLQNTGKLTEKYCFKVKDGVTELDMSDFWLPPIGTYAHPFEGEFNGNGATISNLKVTTDKNRLTNLPSQDRDAFSNAVGMFGMTAQGAEIKNFTLNDPWVEVDSESDYANDTSYKHAGLAVGYAKGNVSDIGVYQGRLNVESAGYTTVNSIIGGYDNTVVDGDDITGAGNVGAGDTGIFYPQEIYSKVSNNNINSKIITGNSITSGSWIISDNSSTNPTSSKGYLGLGCFSFLATNATELRTVGTNGESGDPITTCYEGSVSNKQGSASSAIAVNIATLGLKDSTATTVSSINRSLYIEKSPASISSVTVINENATEGNTAYAVASPSTLYGNSIKFFVSNPSKFRVKILIIANAARQVRISQTMAILDAGSFYFKDSYNKVNETNDPKNGTELVSLTTGTNGVPIYYDLDLSSLGGTKGIYSINSAGNGIDILYLSVDGVDSAEGGEGPKFTISGVDFVYQVSANDSTIVKVTDTTTPFKKTSVLITFSTNDLLLLFFYRPAGGTVTENSTTYSLEVKYKSTSTVPGVTAYGSYSGKLTTDDLTFDSPS